MATSTAVRSFQSGSGRMFLQQPSTTGANQKETDAAAASKGPLDGYRVLDLTRVLGN